MLLSNFRARPLVAKSPALLHTHTHTVPRLRARFLTCRGQIRNSKLLGPRVVLTHDLKNPCFFL